MIYLSTVLMHSWNLKNYWILSFCINIHLLHKYFLCVKNDTFFVCDAETSCLRQMADFILLSHRAAEKSSLFSWRTAAALLCPVHTRPETEAYENKNTYHITTNSLNFYAFPCLYKNLHTAMAQWQKLHQKFIF